MTTYDLHRHLWPEALVEAFAARSHPPFLRGRILELDPGGAFEVDPAAYGLAACLRGLDRDGVDVGVVSCPPTLGLELLPADEAEPLLQAYHAGVSELVAASGGRLRALSVGRVLDGFAGTSVAAVNLLDLDRLAGLLDELDRRKGLLFVHPGPAAPPAGAPTWWAAIVDYAAQMQSAYAAWLAAGAERWPTLRVVFAILAGGAPFQLERLRARGGELDAALNPNLYLDTASYGRRALELCLATYGGGQLVYGSDFPVIDSGPTLEAVRGFGPAAADAMLTQNPERLLG